MKFSLKLLDKNNDLNKIILENIKSHIEKVINKSLPDIENSIKTLVKNALMSEPEYGSLKAGTLRAELGISNPEDVDRVVEAMLNTLEIKINPIKITGNGLNGGFVLRMIKSDDINGIINQDISNVIDSERGYSLPWLEWLLFRGNQTIIQNYSVNYTNSPRSRSGMALMIKSTGNWRVPSNFSGTESDNWTTRAINKIDQQIENIIKTNIENNL